MPDCNLQNPGAQDNTAAGGDICTRARLGAGFAGHFGGLRSVADVTASVSGPTTRRSRSASSRSCCRNLSIDFQYTHHWFGNFVASQDTIRVPTAYDPFCVTPAASANGFPLPSGSSQICGFYNRNPSPAFTPTFLNVTRAKNFGDPTDVYTGYDVNMNLRLPRGGNASGGVSIGHEVTDICDVIGQASVTYAAVAGVLASSAGTIASTTGYPSTLYCHVAPPYQPDIKGLVSYPLPWWGIRASATFQNRPGPQILANYTINATNVATQTTLGRAVTGGSQTTQLIAPATLYNDRFTPGRRPVRQRLQGRQEPHHGVVRHLQPDEQQRGPGPEQHLRCGLADADADSAGTTDEDWRADRFLTEAGGWRAGSGSGFRLQASGWKRKRGTE